MMTRWTLNKFVERLHVRKFRELIILVALFGSLVISFSPSANATTWGAVTVTGLPSSKQIVDVDVSDNGQVVVVVGQYDFVYVSTNGGSTWTKPASVNPSTRDWIGVDVSPDGTKIVAAYNGYLSPSAGDGGVWYSTDSGATWTNRSPTDGMSSFFRLSDVAMSDNGSKMIACGDVYNSSNTGYIWVSTDSGQSWSFGGSPRKYFRGCTMDSDGSVMYASGNGQSGYGGGGGGVFKSTDNGASWSLKTPTGNTNIDDYMWFVATDATGDSVMVSRFSGSSSNLYVSLNGGTTWIASASSFSTVRRTFVSRDGATFVAAISNGIATSSNGSTYTSTTIAGSSAFSAFSASSDMSKAWATHYSSGVFSNGSFVADVVPPSASWTSPSSPSSSRSLSYSLTFTEAVSGIAASDFSNTGTATGCVFTPSGSSGTSVTVSVVCASDGTVVVRLAANSVTDGAANTGPVSAVSAATVSIDTTVTNTTTVVAPNQSSVASATTLPTTGNGGTASITVAPRPSVTLPLPIVTTTTTTPASVTTSTLAPVEIPNVADNAGALVVNGERIDATITRENNELVVTAGMLRARISAVQREGGRAPLDSEGRIRMDQGDSIEIEVTGFGPESQVEVRMYSDPVLLGRSTVSALGNLLASYEVPDSLDDGRHTVVLLGESQQGEELTFALAVFVGAESTGPSALALLVGIPLGVAVIAALMIPAIVRRRKNEEDK